MNPLIQTSAQLAAILRDMADRIDADDSFNGCLEYHASEKHGEFEVVATYAIGNSEGQGGYRMIAKREASP